MGQVSADLIIISHQRSLLAKVEPWSEVAMREWELWLGSEEKEKRMLGHHHSKADIYSYLYYLTEFFSIMTSDLEPEGRDSLTTEGKSHLSLVGLSFPHRIFSRSAMSPDLPC